MKTKPHGVDRRVRKRMCGAIKAVLSYVLPRKEAM